MSISRRNFIKLSGLAVAALVLAGLRQEWMENGSNQIHDSGMSPRERLKQIWLAVLQETDPATGAGNSSGIDQTPEHRAVLDELVAAGTLSAAVADIIQEAYVSVNAQAAWSKRSLFKIPSRNLTSIPSPVPVVTVDPDMTCYVTISISPDQAWVLQNRLLMRLQALEDMRDSNSIDPETLAVLQADIGNEMAMFALSDEGHVAGKVSIDEDIPSDVLADARAAAQFLVDLLVEE